jgi:RecB family exonuclease
VTAGDGGAAARERLRTDLLGWGQERPRVDTEQVAALRERLETGLAEVSDELDAALAASGRRQLLITKSRLDRLACDGWALDPAPFEHTEANVRGTLVHKALERHLDGGEAAAAPAAQVVDRAWHELAASQPGDPRSISAWLNACPDDAAGRLREEVAALLTTFREVWPELPPEAVEVRTEKRLDVTLAGGAVRLQGRLDLLVDSRHRDDRARALVVDFKTGVPRSDHDRAEVRYYALLTALSSGRLPFRWATFYVAEGRPEVEDLHGPTLEATILRILHAVRQSGRLAAVEEGRVAPRLQGGFWCRNCLRQDDCDEADRARRERDAWLAGG